MPNIKEYIKRYRKFFENMSGGYLLVLSLFSISVMSFMLGQFEARGEQTAIILDKAEWFSTSSISSKNCNLNVSNKSSSIKASKYKKPKTSNNSNISIKDVNPNNLFLASKKGSRYYPVNCKAGQSISADNIIYFKTADEAIKAGFVISNSCK